MHETASVRSLKYRAPPTEYMQKFDWEAYELGLINEPVEYDTAKTKEVTKSITDPEYGIRHYTFTR